MATTHTVKQSSPKHGSTGGGKAAPLREPTKNSNADPKPTAGEYGLMPAFTYGPMMPGRYSEEMNGKHDCHENRQLPGKGGSK